MQLGHGVSGEVAADVVEGLAEVLGVGDSVVMLVRGSHPESRHVAFLVLSGSKFLACGGPGSGPEVLLWSLDDFEGIAVVAAKTLSLRRWDGSTVVVGCLHSRAEDEKGFLAALEAGIRAQPSFDAKFHEIGERRVHAVGHRCPDDSGRITARRLHPFLEDDEEVLFACAFMTNSGIDGDALALTNSRVLVYRSDAFGQALATSNRFSNLAAWLFKGSQLQLTDQIGNRVVLGRLRHAKHDLATVQNILRTCMQTDPAQQGTTTAELEHATHYNLHLESPGPAVIEVIKACRAHTGLGLRQAKQMVDACPVVVLRHAPAHEARALHRALIALGATASLTASDDVATPETVPSDSDAGAVDRDDSIDSHDDDQSILDPAGSPLLPLPESAMSLDGEAIADAAFAAWERDDFALAEELWLQAAQLGIARAMVNLGRNRLDEDDFDGAAAWFLRAVDAGSAEGAMWMGTLATERGDEVEQEVWRWRAADLGHPRMLLGLAFREPDPDPAESFNVALMHRAADAGSCLAWGNLSMRAHRRGDHKRCIELGEQALSLWTQEEDPAQLARIHSVLGSSCQAIGRLDQALSHYEKALSLAPDVVSINAADVATLRRDLDIHMLLGWAPYLAGNTLLGGPTEESQARLLEDLQYAVSVSRIREWVAGNPNAPVAVLEDLAHDRDSDVRWALARNPCTPVAVLENLARSKDEALKEILAANPCTPVTVLEALAQHQDNDSVREGVAGNPSTPVGVLEALADQDEFARYGVAGNPSTPVALLEVLADDRVEYVRGAVAFNPSTPVGVLQSLALDKDEVVRKPLAFNPSTPVGVLEVLARDKAAEVRSGVAGNPSTPVGVLEVLAGDKDVWVRYGVAGNPSTPVGVLEVLAGDKDWAANVRWGVAGNPSAPVGVLKGLAGDKKAKVRAKVAGNPSAPVGLLEGLAGDEEAEVREGVAGNPCTPVGLLEALSDDRHDLVRRTVAKNPCTPMGVLLVMARASRDDCRLAWHPRTPGGVLSVLASDTDFKVRRMVAGNLNSPVEVLEFLTQDEVGDVREAVAGNLNSPAWVLETLAFDRYVKVRAAVAKNQRTALEVLRALSLDAEVSVRKAVHKNRSATDEIRAQAALLGV